MAPLTKDALAIALGRTAEASQIRATLKKRKLLTIEVDEYLTARVKMLSDKAIEIAKKDTSNAS